MSFQFSGPFVGHHLPDVHGPALSQFEAARRASCDRPLRPVPKHEALQLVTTRAGFEALEVEWNELFARAGRSEQMFQTFNWLWHWANHFTVGDADVLAIVTIRAGGRLVGVVPLAIERVLGLRQLVFMGAPVSQYGDAVVDTDHCDSAMLERALTFAAATARADVMRLAKVRDDAVIAGALGRLNATLTSAEEAPAIDMTNAGSMAAYEARFSTKARKNRRRLERRLDERGTIDLQWSLNGHAAGDAANATLVLKRAWLKSRGQLSKAFADRRVDDFFASACADQNRPTGAEVHVLRSGGEIANAAISVTIKGRRALHMLAYGLKFEKCAAGVLHVEKLVARAFEDGVETFDFLAPRHDYKLEWADGVVRVGDYAVPVTRTGKVYARVYLGAVRETIKAAAKAAPGLLQNRCRSSVSLLQSAARWFGR